MKLLSSFLSNRRDKKLDVDFKNFRDHEEMASRFTRTLYYGKSPKTDRPSLAMTNLAVKLFSRTIPDRGLGELDMDYAASVSRNACVSPCSLMLALVYIERLRHCNPEYLQTVSSSDTFLVSMMIASKFLYDEGEDDEVFNDEWAASANLEVKEINYLERKFLAALDWNVFVDIITLMKMLHNIESQIAFHEGLNRGWFSYTDLDILSKNLRRQQWLHLFLDHVAKVTMVCAISYLAGLMTIVGSTILVHKGNISTRMGQFLSLGFVESPFAQNAQFSSNLVSNRTSELNVLDAFERSSTINDCLVRTSGRTISMIQHPTIGFDIGATDGALSSRNNQTSLDVNLYRRFTQLGMFTSSSFRISSDKNFSCSQKVNKRTYGTSNSQIVVLAR